MSKLIYGTPTQEELGLFVSKQVVLCQSSLVEELLKREIISFDEIYNLYTTDTDTSDEEPKEEQVPQEIYEWWLVSDWLLDKLEAHGQPVLRTEYGDWWGRTCTGQAIKLDYVIEEIYKETMKA